MLGCGQFGCGPAYFAFGGDQLLWLQPPAARLALVAAGFLPVTVGAFPFNITVGKKAATGGALVLTDRLLFDKALVIQC